MAASIHRPLIISSFSGNSVEVNSRALTIIMNDLFSELDWSAKKTNEEIEKKNRPYTYKYLNIRSTRDDSNPTKVPHGNKENTMHPYEISVTEEYINNFRSTLERLNIPEY